MPPRPVSVMAPFDVAMLLLLPEADNAPLVEIVTAPPAVVVVPEIVSPAFVPVVVRVTGAPEEDNVAFKLTEIADPLLEPS